MERFVNLIIEGLYNPELENIVAGLKENEIHDLIKKNSLLEKYFASKCDNIQVRAMYSADAGTMKEFIKNNSTWKPDHSFLNYIVKKNYLETLNILNDNNRLDLDDISYCVVHSYETYTPLHKEISRFVDNTTDVCERTVKFTSVHTTINILHLNRYSLDRPVEIKVCPKGLGDIDRQDRENIEEIIEVCHELVIKITDDM